MKLRSALPQFLLIVFTISLFTACRQSSQKNEETGQKAENKENVASKEPEIKIDTVLDNIAAFISGMEQTAGSQFKSLENYGFWKEEKKFFDDNWAKMTKERLVPMQAWSQAEIKPNINPELTMFYPFSGPDFLHAYYLYPDATNFVFLALEPIGKVPPIGQYNEKELESYVSYINEALRDIYKRSYFITLHMMGDLRDEKAKGVIPIFMVFLKRTNHEMVSLERIAMNNKGEILAYTPENETQLAQMEAQGVRFKFKVKGENKLKTLTYFSMDVEDKNIAEHEYFINWVKSFKEVNTFVKSASYLMHYGTFNQIREATLGISRSVLQDDTGIAFRFFDPAVWQFQLYGEYTQPIEDFKGMKMQADLRKAYETDNTRKSMPFSLGYHWKDAKQNYLFAKKK